MAVTGPRVALTRGIGGEWVSRDGRWHVAVLRLDPRANAGRDRAYRVTDVRTGDAHRFPLYRLYEARELINDRLAREAREATP